MAAAINKTTSSIAGAAALIAALAGAPAAAQKDCACAGAPGMSTFILLAALGSAPLVFMAATSFVKISVVFSILRNALGIGQTPSGAVIAVLAAVLTFYVMTPVGREMAQAGSAAVAEIDWSNVASRRSLEAAKRAINTGGQPLRRFLHRNSGARETDLFVGLARRAQAVGVAPAADDFTVALPAFLLTELKEAFQIGFLVYIPFLVVDIVVANVLLALGMHMIAPATVSLPFKLLVFVLVDGWYLLAQALVFGYR